ncbi:MAG: hypothetical protein HYS86_03935 [Candidatus Chisholmbacteria bacterium]|nr:hypothetical protein [Candidatus Chisholmbacteria bacterium]
MGLRSFSPKVNFFFSFFTFFLLVTLFPFRVYSSTLLKDDFNDNTINNALWTEAFLGTGPSISESNQRLEITIPGDSVDDPITEAFIAGYFSQCKFRGDFDIQVDYNLLVWPFKSGVRVGLVTKTGLLGNDVALVERIGFGAPTDFSGYPRDVYLTDFGGGIFTTVTTNDLLGKLRLVRNGNTLQGQYYNADSGNWVTIDSHNRLPEEVSFGLLAWSHNNFFTDQNVLVAFDNFLINQGQLVCGDVGVPYFSQLDDQWKDDQYDSLAATIGQVGCTLSAATMTLSHYGINSLPDGSALNVGNLNEWFNQNPDKDWRNGLTPWTALIRLSKIMHNTDSTIPILDYKKISPPDFDEIDQILSEKGQPLIFEENQPFSPSGVHFTAATGVVTSAQEYSILDPFEASRASMLLPPDELISARYLFPVDEAVGAGISALNSTPNLSYVILHADLGLDTLITNPEDNKLGKNKAGDEFSEIANSLFDMGYPLAVDDDPSETTGEAFWEYTLPDPISGQYQIEFNTGESDWYDFELYAYDQDANPMVFKETEVFVGSFYPATYRLDYTQAGGENFASLNKVVDFETLRNDVEAMRLLNGIDKGGVEKLLTVLVNQAERFYPTSVNLTNLFLDQFESQLNRHHPRFIDDQAYEFLLSELELLKLSL